MAGGEARGMNAQRSLATALQGLAEIELTAVEALRVANPYSFEEVAAALEHIRWLAKSTTAKAAEYFSTESPS